MSIDASALAYDYERIPASDRAFVMEAALRIKMAAAMTVQCVALAGQQLAAVRDRLRDQGQWLEWTRVEFGLSERTAYNYVDAYERVLSRVDTEGALDNLQLGAVYRLAQVNTPAGVRQAALDAAQDGQRVTRRWVEDLIGLGKEPGKSRQPSGGQGATAPPDGSGPVRMPAIDRMPDREHADFAGSVPAEHRARVMALANAWSDWLADLAADLEELGASPVRAVA